MEETTTSTDGGQASTSGSPQAGTPATDGQAPMSQVTTEHERIIAELRKENAASRIKLTAYEKQEKEAAEAKKAAELAQLSENEKTKKLHAEAEQQKEFYKKQLVMAQVKLAAQGKNIVDPDLAALAIQDKLELDENGMPTNLDKILDDLIKNKPYLVKAEAATTPATTPAQTANQRTAPATPAMNPGRSNIASPNTLPQGQTMRLDQLNWKGRG